MISNAGGVNPEACARAIKKAAKSQGVNVKIAVVMGDDMINRIDEVTQADVKELQSGQDFPARVVSMNAYLGCIIKSPKFQFTTYTLTHKGMDTMPLMLWYININLWLVIQLHTTGIYYGTTHWAHGCSNKISSS